LKKLISAVLCLTLVVALAACAAPAPAAPPAPAPAAPGAATPTPAAPDGPAPGAATFDELMQMDWAQIEEHARAEGGLTFWVWHNEVGFRELTNAFTDRFGISVDLLISEKTAGEMMAIAEAGSAVGSLDVMTIGGEFVIAAMGANLFSGPILDKMQEGQHLDPALRVMQEGLAHHGYIVPVYLNQTGLLYNPRVVTERPQTWAELEAWIDANPRRFGFSTAAGGGTGQSFVHSVIEFTTGGLDQYHGDTAVDPAKHAQWDAVWQWFNDRSDRLTITTSNIDSISRLNQGELHMVVAWNDQAYNLINQGELFADAVLYVPNFGMVGGGDTMGLLANAPNPAAGLLFLNWITSREGQSIMVEVMQNFPAHTGVATAHTLLDPACMQNRVSWIPAVYKSQFIEDFTRYVLMG